MIETVAGKGTYVTPTSAAAPARDFTALHRTVDELIERARVLGYEVGELAHLVQLKAHTYRPPLTVELVFVGIFSEATRAYAAELQRFLRPSDHLRAVTLEALKTQPERRAQATQADLSEVVVYATGSEAVTEGLPKGGHAFEYRHTPEPRSVEPRCSP